ncbi:hypothetical protein AMATHDRAFT_11479 [Amanita thiersii Skay4041]|uniref:Uncharacterized protein n=1 Tax=Amanita thiersii Skay4041 TaxID=703135 RepID=A0A2A9N8X9_9AGAR|nr:hypothetical protein AMATHDRAFT_11479 [Amanita thiersii Skay4041]
MVQYFSALWVAILTPKTSKDLNSKIPAYCLPYCAKLLDCKIYPLNLEEQQQLDEFLQENLSSG